MVPGSRRGSYSDSGVWPDHELPETAECQRYQVHTNPLSEPVPKQADASQYFRPVPRRRKPWRTALYWLQDHVWVYILLLILLAFVIVMSVAVAVCSQYDCKGLPIRKSQSVDLNQEPYQDIPRMLVAFTNTTLDALDVIPPMLRPFVTRILLQTSAIQLLNFTDEATLSTARSYLAAHPELDFLTRDFRMAAQLPSVTNATAILTAAISYTQSPTNRSWEETLSDALNGNTQTGKRRRQAQQVTMQGAEPNDPLYRSGSQWFLSHISAPTAWQIGAGSSDVIIAIIDSGMDMTHPDLASNLWVNKAEIPGNGVDDDGNGYIDDINGWDFAGKCAPATGQTTCSAARCKGQAIISDSSSHGTGVAGVVGAVVNNQLGGVGVAPGVRLMVLRVADCMDGTIYASAAAAAFDYALKMGASIVQASFGGSYPYGFSPESPAPWYHAGWTRAYTVAMQPLADQGILVVAAAGNEAINMDNMNRLGYSYCPCLTPLSNVLCVMSSDPDDSQSSFSNYGNASVHLAAPGTVVMTTATGGTYTPLTGSSFSAPIVTGVAALALTVLGAADGNYKRASEVRSALINSVSVAPGLQCNTSGRVSADGSLAAALTIATNSFRSNPLLRLPVGLPVPPSLQPQGTTQPLISPSTPSAMFSGYMDYYYLTTDNGQLPTNTTSLQGLTLIDVSPRTSPVAYFQSFKYSTGTIVSIRCHVLLTRVGVWSIRVSSAGASSTYRLLVGGRVVPMSNQGQGAWLVTVPGLYSWELQLAPPLSRAYVRVKAPTSADANSSLLQDASGGVTDWVFMGAAYTMAGTRYRPPGFGPAMTASAPYEASLLSHGWYLRYNMSRFSGTISSSDPKSLPVNISSSSTGLPLSLAKSLASFLLGVPQSNGAPTGPPVLGSSTSQQPSTRFIRAARLPGLAFSDAGALQDYLSTMSSNALTADSVISQTGVVTAAGNDVLGGTLGVVGWATTVMRSSMMPPRIVVRALCRACLLLFNDLPVMDGWEPSVATSVTTSTSPLIPRISGCITLSPNELIRMSLIFASTDVSWNPLVVGWAPCETADQGVFQQFASSVGIPDLWETGGEHFPTGVVPGVQCDVWRSPATVLAPGSADVGFISARLDSSTLSSGAITARGSWFTSLTPQQVPDYKARLPTCTNANCTMIWSFTLESLFPALAALALGPKLNVRCWTYWSGSFRSGPRALPAKTTNAISIAPPTSVYLGGQQVWSGGWPGVVNSTTILVQQPGWATAAPTSTALGGSMQQLVVEWFEVDASSRLTLLDGNTVITMLPGTAQLPVAMAVQASDASLIPPVGQVAVGPAGHYSVAVTPATGDITPLVNTRQSGLKRLGVNTSPGHGLDFLASYANNIGSQVRYCTAYGFLQNLDDVGWVVSLVVPDSYASATTVLAGGVTLLAPRAFSSVSFMTTPAAVTIAIPAGGFVPIAVIVKAARLDGKAQFKMMVSAPPELSGPVDNMLWFRATGVAADMSLTGDVGAAVALGIL